MKFLQIIIGPLRNNCYILSGNGRDAVIIDPSGNYERISKILEEAELLPSYVLLTHGHFDHIGAVKQLQDAGAEVYMHPDDNDKINIGHRKIPPFIPDKNLKDGQVLKLAGLDITVIHTPGHSSGSVCFLINNMLFSGDTLFCGAIGRTDLLSGNFEQLRRNIKEKLFTLPPETTVLPGHEEKTSIGEEKTNNRFLK